MGIRMKRFSQGLSFFTDFQRRKKMEVVVRMMLLGFVFVMMAGNAMGQQAPLFWRYGYDEKMDYPYSIELVNDGSTDPCFVIAGRTEDIFASVLKINPRGIQEWEWQLTAGDPGIPPIGEAMSIMSIDDGFIVAGWVTTSNDEEAFLAKLDEFGSLLWMTTHGGDGCQKATDVCEIVSQESTEPEGYAVSGYDQESQETLLMIFDLQGNLEDVYTYRRLYQGYGCSPTCILQTDDGGFALGGLAGIVHYNPDLGIGFMLKVDDHGQYDWFHLNTDLNHGSFGQCLIQRPNGNYYLLGARGPGMYPHATIVEIDQNGEQVGSPRVFTEIAAAGGDIQTYGFSLEPFTAGEYCYGVCGESCTDIWENDFDLFFMAIDDNLNIESIAIHGLEDVIEGTLHENNAPYTGSVACQVLDDKYIITASTDYREASPNRDIYVSGYFLDPGNETTSAGENGEAVPSSISVEGYPSSGTASIVISLASDCHVHADVYDLYGRKVGTITEGYMASGDHTVAWDPSENVASSGVYFVHLVAGDESDTEKLVIIK
jgi:hypothetical protein